MAKIQKYLTTGALLLPAVLICFPVFLILTGSVMDSMELKEYLLPVFGDGTGFIRWKGIPDYPTFAHYGRLLFLTPSFFVLFWNSVKLVVCILAGQLLAGVPAAWAFAAYPVRGSRALFALYVVLMLLPFQVTMLSSYLVLDRLSLMNTHAAVILPAVFSTFPVFLAYGGFRALPPQLFEAARIDGAGELRIFVTIGLPLGKSGILSAIVLGFLEYWNLMEQPLAFLEEKALWPLSLYLPEISWMQAGFALCASFVTLIPAAFVFVLGQDYLEQGIVYSGLKE
ncbi:MAG: carbohydrate ABC transporter permease [Bacteroidales bacterium]|nr:carbohydrate ABC transporter permease [Bacteroidales bacterium]MCM1416022.1 carbohydrate ABC transporter permease [bacterium]MCM1423833.1 carbohydrate ABC transporter permease [bacterium]